MYIYIYILIYICTIYLLYFVSIFLLFVCYFAVPLWSPVAKFCDLGQPIAGLRLALTLRLPADGVGHETVLIEARHVAY